jgi:tetrahydromethanopterin S-methyltransferase subunit B
MENAMTTKVLEKSEIFEATELSLDDLDQATGGRHHHHHGGGTTEQVVYGVIAGVMVAGMLVAIFA